MKRRTTIATGVTAGVAMIGVGALAIAAPWQPDEDPTATATGNAAVTATQARWGAGNGEQVQGGGGQGFGQGQGRNGHGARQGASTAPGSQGTHDPTATLPASGHISTATVDELLYMAEEEKLAHDLYVALGGQYDARQFDNIARAETKHLDAVRVLLDRYDLDDPTTDNPAGVFDDTTLQQLYDDLLSSGSASLAAAAAAGVAVETIDIADLTAAIEGTDAPDVVQVLSSLRDGSQRHLAAFERLAERD